MQSHVLNSSSLAKPLRLLHAHNSKALFCGRRAHTQHSSLVCGLQQPSQPAGHACVCRGMPSAGNLAGALFSSLQLRPHLGARASLSSENQPPAVAACSSSTVHSMHARTQTLAWSAALKHTSLFVGIEKMPHHCPGSTSEGRVPSLPTQSLCPCPSVPGQINLSGPSALRCTLLPCPSILHTTPPCQQPCARMQHQKLQKGAATASYPL